MNDIMNEMMILGVVFGEEAVQINFVESKHTTPRGGIEQSMQLARKGINDLLQDIESALCEVIEEYFVDLREPPDQLPGGPRLRNRHDDDDS